MVFSHLPARRPGAVVDAAVAGIDDAYSVREIAVGFGLHRASGLLRWRRPALERKAAHEALAVGPAVRWSIETGRLPHEMGSSTKAMSTMRRPGRDR